jgi:hypothetical protein
VQSAEFCPTRGTHLLPFSLPLIRPRFPQLSTFPVYIASRYNSPTASLAPPPSGFAALATSFTALYGLPVTHSRIFRDRPPGLWLGLRFTLQWICCMEDGLARPPLLSRPASTLSRGTQHSARLSFTESEIGSQEGTLIHPPKCSHLSASFRHRRLLQRACLRPPTRTRLRRTCDRCIHVDGDFSRPCAIVRAEALEEFLGECKKRSVFVRFCSTDPADNHTNI